jgi:hypothetical protein
MQGNNYASLKMSTKMSGIAMMRKSIKISKGNNCPTFKISTKMSSIAKV